MKLIKIFALSAFATLFWGCNSTNNSDEPVEPVNPPSYSSESLVVVNAGNFGYSNSTITIWNDDNGAVSEAFFKANRFKLGDTAQSVTVYGGKTWIVVNNSNVVFAVDSETFKEVGRIDDGIVSPRYIHFVSEDTAYITQMYSTEIAVVNPKTFRVIGYMNYMVKDEGSLVGGAEEMVQIGSDVFANVWSYDNRILKIDAKSNNVFGEIKVGLQPYSIAKDCDGNLWVLCDGGGWENNPAGYECPVLMCMDPLFGDEKRSLRLPLGDSVSKFASNADGSKLYFIQNHYNEDFSCTSQIIEVDTRATDNWTSVIVSATDKTFYSLTVSPLTGDIFAADAIDYTQPGVIYRYSSDGKLISSFNAGVIPTSYAWILKK